MSQLQHHARPVPVRGIAFGKWQWVANTALVTAAFVFVGAVTLGLFP